MKVIKEFHGWIAGNLSHRNFRWEDDGLNLWKFIGRIRGTPLEWGPGEWPPRKVRILIVEDEK